MDEGFPFLASRVARLVGYVRKDGIRYGCTSNKKSKVDCYAFIRNEQLRTPAEISALFILQLAEKAPQVCALIRRMTADDNIPQLPWDL